MSRVLRREWTTAEGWRDTKAGMWAWLIQRGAAVALLGLVLLHALLGVRALLLDVGLPVRWHRVLFILALLLAAVLFALVWRWRWY